MTAAIDITPEQRKTLLEFLRRHLPGVAVWAYGSRVKWTARPNSDLDLVAFARPEQRELVAELKEDLNESNLPFLVDLHVWDDIPEKFREIIRKQYVVLQDTEEKRKAEVMAGEWETVPLESLYDFGSGLSKPREEFGFGHGFLSFKDVFYNYFVPTTLSQLVNSTPKEQKACSIIRGDVFLTRTSETMDELGMSCVALKNYEGATFNGFTKRLRPKAHSKIVPEYAGYYFRSPKFRRDITAMSSLSTRASLNNEMLARLTIDLPPVEVQTEIGLILKALDDKIELNRRMNATLEEMARALFQSWFVDFDPVRAKLDGRQPVGLDEAGAALFPATFQDSPLGHIPNGWEIGRLDDVLTLQRGFDLPATDRSHGRYPVVMASGPNGWHDEYKVKGPGVTTGRSGVLGQVFFIHDDFWPLNTSLWVKEYKGISPAYAFHLLHGLDFEAFNAGSAVPTLNRNHVHNLPVVIPPRLIVDAFDLLIMPLMKQQKANDDQSRTLATLRDTLLPKLLSGELSLASLESKLEAVA